jgi:hypothetical protein
LFVHQFLNLSRKLFFWEIPYTVAAEFGEIQILKPASPLIIQNDKVAVGRCNYGVVVKKIAFMISGTHLPPLCLK